MIRILSVVALLSALLAGTAAAKSLSEDEIALLRRIAADPDKQEQASVILNGAPPADARQTRQIAQPVRSAPAPYRDEFATLVRKNEVDKAPADQTKSRTAQQPAQPKQYSECAGFMFLLRKDWKDIDFAGCPQAAKKAIGAEVAFSDDRAAGNRIWAVNGTAALLYNSIADQPAWWNPDYLSFGVYTTVNRTLNSSPTVSAANVDKLAYGVATTLGYLDDNGGHFFSLRGGGVENNVKNTSAASFTFEYQPVVDFLYFSAPIQRPFGLPYFLRFDPSLVVQYNEVAGSKQILDFNNRTEALRVGPQITAYLNAYPGGTTFLSRMNASFTYHWAYEAYSRTNLTWLSTAVGFNLDDAGHLAIAFTYNRGSDEDTGTFTNMYRVGLTGKI
jgi:hypothetical protein